MELVSLFCFGANAGRIDPELFTLFMSYVIKGSSRTKDFSPFPEHGIDATPVVRSFLLQQLLRTGLVKKITKPILISYDLFQQQNVGLLTSAEIQTMFHRTGE